MLENDAAIVQVCPVAAERIRSEALTPWREAGRAGESRQRNPKNSLRPFFLLRCSAVNP